MVTVKDRVSRAQVACTVRARLTVRVQVRVVPLVPVLAHPVTRSKCQPGLLARGISRRTCVPTGYLQAQVLSAPHTVPAGRPIGAGRAAVTLPCPLTLTVSRAVLS